MPEAEECGTRPTIEINVHEVREYIVIGIVVIFNYFSVTPNCN